MFNGGFGGSSSSSLAISQTAGAIDMPSRQTQATGKKRSICLAISADGR